MFDVGNMPNRTREILIEWIRNENKHKLVKQSNAKRQWYIGESFGLENAFCNAGFVFVRLATHFDRTAANMRTVLATPIDPTITLKLCASMLWENVSVRFT